MKKILIIGLTSNVGGIETNIINFYKKINKSKYKIDFINRSKKPLAFQDFFINNGSKVWSVTSYYKNSAKYFIELLRILEIEQYDCIYCNFSSARYITPALCAKFYSKSKILIHVHNSNTDKNIIIRLKNFINKKILGKLGDYYISCSKEASQWFYSKKAIEGKNHFIITNFIDNDKFLFKKENRLITRSKLKINNELVIGHIGKYSKCKNQDFLIEIFKYLKNKKINVKMILIGGNYENSFINDEDIILTGIVNNVEEILSGIDVFVFPSLYEGYGISLVEAQMLKIPCLASDTIPKTTKISNCVEYLNLNLGIETWANKIVELSKVDRNRIKITKINNNYNFKMLLKIFEEC